MADLSKSNSKNHDYICWKSCDLIAPVTALEFLGTQLFCGEGPNLSIYEVSSGSRVTIARALPKHRVHCIKVSDVVSPTVIVACGGKAVSILHLEQHSSKLSVVKTALFIDWIWDICLLDGTENESSKVLLATGHNSVWLWDSGTGVKTEVSHCEEQCILYCARFIGKTFDNMWLACGTVFNEVLLWKITNNRTDIGSVRVSRRLKGHDGVIFSITFDEQKQILCSVSDDRSIKVWKLVCTLENCSDNEVVTEPLLVLYGHKARVWDCLVVQDYIVSVGEDLTTVVWNMRGEIAKTFKGHIGKSIWSLAANGGGEMIATGGGDGSVRLWSLSDNTSSTQEQHVCSIIPHDEESDKTNKDIPRSLALLSNNDVLVMTDRGDFYSYRCFQNTVDISHTESWKFLRNEHEFCSYSVMALSPCRTIIALGNIYGKIKIQSATEPRRDEEKYISWCPFETKPYTDKVLSLYWIDRDKTQKAMNLFSCGPNGWPNSIYVPPKEIICSDTLHEVSPLVLCGDRRGSLHVFRADTKEEPTDPLLSHIGIHGRNGVTHITANHGFIYSAGRDGYFRQYEFQGTDVKVLNKKKAFKGLEWIEQLKFTKDGDLLVLGFHTIDFVIWSMRRNEILLRIPCGGGHRVWDFSFCEFEQQTNIIFTYLKKKAVHVHQQSEQKARRTCIFQESFHGREATCLCFIGPQESDNKGTPTHLLATGSEDTNVNIMAYNPLGTQRRLSKLFTCQGHISSVRCLALIRVNNAHANTAKPSECLLFSGGGRASLKCWSVNLSTVTFDKPTVVSFNQSEPSHPTCTLLAELPHQVSRYRRKRVQRQFMEGSFCDIRFMSVSVFSLSELLPSNTFDMKIGVIIGCSDGLLRFYVLESDIKEFRLIGHHVWNDKCILCVGHFVHGSSNEARLVVYTADTAGRIAFWDLTELFTQYFLNIVQCENEELQLLSEDCSRSDQETLESSVSVGTEERNIASEYDGYPCKSFAALHTSCGQNILNQQSTDGFCAKPFYARKIHQSGINDICLLQQDNGRYLMCTAGDDAALTVASFEVHKANETLEMHSWCATSAADAHTSSTTGVKILDGNHILSVSVDQRLKLWNIVTEHSEMSVTLSDSYFVDVADVQDIAVHRNRDGSYLVAVCGVGLQMLNLKCSY